MWRMAEAISRSWLAAPLTILVLCACGGGGSAASGQPGPGAGSGIGPSGGMASEATGAQVVVPAGALAASTAIAVTRSSTGAPALPAGLAAFGPMFAFTPHGTHFAVPATIIIPFDAASVPQGTAPRLFKTNATQSGWEEVQGATVEGGVMKGPVTGFSFAVVAGEPSTSTNLSVSSIDPDHGPAHTLVRLTGQGFSATPEDNDVRLNNKSCVVREASATGLTVEVPPQAGSGNFQVFTQTGTALSAIFTYEVTAVQVTTIAGAEGGFVDDVGSAARFMSVAALAVSASGTIFVADSGNHAVRVVSPSASVGTLAGGSEGHADGVGIWRSSFVRPGWHWTPTEASTSRTRAARVGPTTTSARSRQMGS